MAEEPSRDFRPGVGQLNYADSGSLLADDHGRRSARRDVDRAERAPTMMNRSNSPWAISTATEATVAHYED
jgi:hypothetical protein